MTRMGQVRMIGCVVAVGVSFALASCTSPSASPSTSATPASTPAATAAPTDGSTASPSAAATVSQPPASTTLDGIDATGAFGEAPQVTVPSPWAIDKTQTKILVQGDGPEVGQSGYIQLNYYGVDARTGETFDESYSKGAPATFDLGGVVAGFQKGLAGQKTGTRLIIAMPGSDAYDGSGGRPESGIAMGDTLIFVVDILRAEFSEPTGQTVTVTDPDLPVVAGDLNAPTVTIPSDQPAPAGLTVQPLIKGSGPVVEATDGIVVNYAEYVWSTGAMVRQTYGFTPLEGMLSSTIPGWQQALAGQTMGSRLLLVVPPDLAYPEGAPKIGVEKGSTMVYVIDILYSMAAAS